MLKPLLIYSWPRAILHVDGDAFFASCEQVLHPELRGLPVVVGGERGIATALSYEAKALGLRRGMKTHEIKKRFPQVVITGSDYETYSLFSTRMFDIVRRYTSEVEESSIDECYADLTGLQRPLGRNYETMACDIKKDLEVELGMTFSLGLAPTKSLAKIASNLNKPSGLTIIPGKKIQHCIKDLPVEAICGVGSKTGNYLRKMGIDTITKFVYKDQHWVENTMTKPYKQLYYELRGISLIPVKKQKKVQKSISKTRTFYPPSDNRDLLFGQLSKNIEAACARARMHGLRASEVHVFLKRQDFIYSAARLDLTIPTNVPHAIVRLIPEVFERIYKPGLVYRSTGVTLSRLVYGGMQEDLFGNHVEIENLARVFKRVDHINNKYGRHTVHLASSNEIVKKGVTRGKRKHQTGRSKKMLKGETKYKRLSIPYLGEVR